MSYAINQCSFGGYLTRDVQVKHVGANSTAVALFGIAVNRRVKRGNEWVEEATFLDVQIWGKSGEAFARYHQKGSPCLLPDCEMVWEKWQDKQTGEDRTKLYVKANGFSFLPRPKDGEPARSGSSIADDDVPF